MTKTVALVVAAGRGRRFGGPLPKLYAELAGRPVLGHGLARLATHPRIDRVQAVICSPVASSGCSMCLPAVPWGG